MVIEDAGPLFVVVRERLLLTRRRVREVDLYTSQSQASAEATREEQKRTFMLAVEAQALGVDATGQVQVL